MTSIYLVRHAHANWEPSEERPLSDRGRAAARLLAERLGELSISAIYSSPARRAVQTVTPLAEAHGFSPVIVPDLRERELVVASGMTFETAVQAAWRDPQTAGGGGESNEAGAARGVRVLRRILSSHQHQSIVVSTHGNLLALMLNHLDPSYGHEAWRALTFPDVFRLTFQDQALLQRERVWTETTGDLT